MSHRKTGLLATIFLHCLFAAMASAEIAPAGLKTKVLSVVDGDTIQIDYQSRKELVRMIGIATPESHYPGRTMKRYAADAVAYTRKMIEGKQVFLEFDEIFRDKHGRLFAYVWLDQPTLRDNRGLRRGMINAQLLLSGYAQTAGSSPNAKYAALFDKFEREAMRCRRGLWSLPTPWTKRLEILDASYLLILDRDSGAVHTPTCPYVSEIRNLEIVDIKKTKIEIMTPDVCCRCGAN